MLSRIVLIAALLLLIAACEDAPQQHTSKASPTPTPSLYTGYLTNEIPPCTPISGSSVDPCNPASSVGTGGGFAGNSYDLGDAPEDVTSSLTLNFITAIVPHIVIRGTYIPGTVRCTSETPYRQPSYVSFEDSLNWESYAFQISCYADVRVNSYILGNGPPQLPVQVWFYTYWRENYREDAESREYREFIEQLRKHYEAVVPEEGYYAGNVTKGSGGVEPGGIMGKELVLFIGPAWDHSAEAWQVYETWEVQRREGGTVIAVHPHRDAWKSLRSDEYVKHLSVLEQELSHLEQKIAAAHQSRVSEYGGRIGADTSLPLLISDIHSLGEFMVSAGAYDHPDGIPPPPPVPGEGDPVPDIGVDDSTPGASPAPPGGVEDSPTAPAAAPPAPQAVNASLADGKFTISWDAVTGAARYKAQSRKSGSDEEWADVETTGTRSSTFSPVGGPDCGSTYEFRALSYGDGTTYAADWSEPSDAASVPTGACNQGPEFGAASYSFSIAEDTATGSSVGSVIATDPDEAVTVSYSITAGNEDGKFVVNTGTGEITVADALDYETTALYTLTVQAGDGNGGSATATVAVSVTEVGVENQTPFFEISSYYSYSVPEDAAEGASVGAVSATEIDEGDTVSYAITAGNEDGHFTIDAGTGAITVAGALDYETTSSYTLTVVASDGNGGSATAWVTVAVTDVDENPSPGS